MEKTQPRNVSPHVLVFPIPAQSHVDSMLKLAELLSLAGVLVTFLNSDHIHEHLSCSGVGPRFTRYPNFRFKTIPDGLPADYPRSSERILEVIRSIISPKTKTIFRQMLGSGHFSSGGRPPVSCIIADGHFGFPKDVGREFHIPIIIFRTISSCYFWTNHCISDMFAAGELPIKGSEDMDRVIKSVPGMEAFLRCRDLPSFCRAEDFSDPILQVLMRESRRNAEANGLILNTFEDLDRPILAHIRTIFPKLYAIGPLNIHLTTRIPEQADKTPSSYTFWEVDRSCMAWLDAQPLDSVIYVSFGSITPLTREQLLEFWHGLVNSDQRFLWVVRPDSVNGEVQMPEELTEATKERGYIVGWAPQEEVLNHPAVGGYLTHSGWNSTLESVVAGVPMICWPYFADQQVNSRFVAEVWKLGLDMKDTCERNIVEQMVRDLMVRRKDEFKGAANKMAELATKSVSKGGSSYCALEHLIKDVKAMSKTIT